MKKPISLMWLALVLMLVPFSIWAQTVVYVDSAATGANSGANWVDAFTSLNAAIQNTTAPTQVWVATGTYYPGASRTDSFVLKANLELYGGFTSGMTALTQRDWNANPSSLSGEIQQDADPDNNAYHVVTAAANARLDGFTITAGSANGATPSDKGGALYVSGLGTAAPVLANCLFAFNKATSGGGIYNNGCSVQIFDSIFAGNAATDSGGGMYNAAGANLIIVSNCVFRQNTAAAGIEGGGAIYNKSVQKLTVADCRFIGNQATGTGYNSGGGAMYSHSIYWPTFVVTNCVFAGNSCAGNGGGAVRTANSDNLLYKACVFSGNSVTEPGAGGAFCSFNGLAVIEGCSFAGNTAGRGGAFEAFKGFNIRNSLFVGNKAGDNNNDAGGAVCRYNGKGGDVCTFGNCTFSGNWAKYGGAIKVHIPAQIMINNNCIFWNNIASVAGNELYGDTNTVNYCNVNGGWTGKGTSNLDVDPLFVGGPGGTWTSVGAYDPTTGQTVLTCSSAAWMPGAYAGLFLHPNMTKIPQLAIATNTADTITVWGNAATLASIGSTFQVWDYHLKSKGGRWTPLKPDPAEWIKDRTHSPCIDAGDPAAVRVWEPQKNGDRVNIGAYGNTAQASKTLPPPSGTTVLIR